MKKNWRVRSIVVTMLLSMTLAAQADVQDIVNYRAYSPSFASAGQPDAAGLEAARDAGFERIIYLAYSDQERSLPAEDRLVKNLGMQYLHVPVEWESPTRGDFELFAAAMRVAPEKKTLLHCQVNYRASAFSLLYRVIYQDVPLPTALADMYAVWTPNDTWRAFVLDVLRAYDVSPECDGCEWRVAE